MARGDRTHPPGTLESRGLRLLRWAGGDGAEAAVAVNCWGGGLVVVQNLLVVLHMGNGDVCSLVMNLLAIPAMRAALHVQIFLYHSIPTK